MGQASGQETASIGKEFRQNVLRRSDHISLGERREWRGIRRRDGASISNVHTSNQPIFQTVKIIYRDYELVYLFIYLFLQHLAIGKGFDPIARGPLNGKVL